MKLGECLDEVVSGVGADWSKYPVLGATRAGLAAAKEPVGKQPERYKLVTPGTVFYNPMRILLGSIAMVDDGGPTGITSPDYVVVRPKPGMVHHRWFYYWLRSTEGAALIKSLTRGAVRERLLFRRLAAGEVDIPPYPVQARFAGAIQHVALARVAAEARLEAAEAMTGALRDRAFRNLADEGVSPIALAEALLGPGQYGLSSPMTLEPVGLPVLRMGNISPGKIDWADLRYVDLPAADSAKYRLRDGDIVFNRTNSAELVGKSAVFRGEREALFASYLIRFRLNREKALPEYVCAYINSGSGRTFVRRHMGRAVGQVNISASVMARMPLPLPDPERQRKIVAALEGPDASDAEQAARSSMAAVAALPAALLHRAFRGEL